MFLSVFWMVSIGQAKAGRRPSIFLLGKMRILDVGWAPVYRVDIGLGGMERPPGRPCRGSRGPGAPCQGRRSLRGVSNKPRRLSNLTSGVLKGGF
jgi:hypothetical protein